MLDFFSVSTVFFSYPDSVVSSSNSVNKMQENIKKRVIKNTGNMNSVICNTMQPFVIGGSWIHSIKLIINISNGKAILTYLWWQQIERRIKVAAQKQRIQPNHDLANLTPRLVRSANTKFPYLKNKELLKGAVNGILSVRR